MYVQTFFRTVTAVIPNLYKTFRLSCGHLYHGEDDEEQGAAPPQLGDVRECEQCRYNFTGYY